MKTKVYLIVICFSAIACNKYPSPYSEIDIETNEYPQPYRDLRDFPAIASETNVDTLMSIMIKKDCVYSSSVGIGGAYTKEYAAFERLSQLLNDKEMFKLIEHPNATMRLYAYRSLKINNSNYLQEAEIHLIKDTAIVCSMSGCMQLNMQLRDFL